LCNIFAHSYMLGQELWPGFWQKFDKSFRQNIGTKAELTKTAIFLQFQVASNFDFVIVTTNLAKNDEFMLYYLLWHPLIAISKLYYYAYICANYVRWWRIELHGYFSFVPKWRLVLKSDGNLLKHNLYIQENSHSTTLICCNFPRGMSLVSQTFSFMYTEEVGTKINLHKILEQQNLNFWVFS